MIYVFSLNFGSALPELKRLGQRPVTLCFSTMTANEAFLEITSRLTDLYGPSEAASVAAIVLEDAFGVRYKQLDSNSQKDEISGEKLESIIVRLLRHEPVQYVMGKTFFYGLPFVVNTDVLIPRQETEELVAWVLEFVKVRTTADEKFLILDVGTGSGCIAVTLKKKFPAVAVHALDVSKAALKTAEENARLNKTHLLLHHHDILNEAEWPQFPVFDVIVSNPPYVSQSERHLIASNVLKYEPHSALFTPNSDPNFFIGIIGKFARNHLAEKGGLFFEINEYHAEEARQILLKTGFSHIEIRKDLNGKDRMLKALFS